MPYVVPLFPFLVGCKNHVYLRKRRELKLPQHCDQLTNNQVRLTQLRNVKALNMKDHHFNSLERPRFTSTWSLEDFEKA